MPVYPRRGTHVVKIPDDDIPPAKTRGSFDSPAVVVARKICDSAIAPGITR